LSLSAVMLRSSSAAAGRRWRGRRGPPLLFRLRMIFRCRSR